MKSLRKISSRYMVKTACVWTIFIIIMLVFIQVITSQNRAIEEAKTTFLQIESVLRKNQQELIETKENYKETCLRRAETVARIIENEPEVLNSVEEIKKIAQSVEVDAIHIFDTTGKIFAGTQPEYFGATFDSGEQMMFFKPMLKDKSLKLVQDIMPNTAESKLMQYSAVWSKNGEYIVQVGMEPISVMKVTEKNQLSYIFSLFRVNPEANYYAINSETGEVVGSTEQENVGLNASEIGLNLERIQEQTNGFCSQINGKRVFCIFKKIDSNYIGRVVEEYDVYKNVPITTLWITLSLIVITFLLVKAVMRYMDKYIIKGINDTNEKLKNITDGDLEEKVDIQNSIEFVELSEHINSMVKSLLDNNKKMSYALSKTNMYICTYEYGDNKNKVSFIGYVTKIFDIDNDKMEQFISNSSEFKAFIDDIKKEPMPEEKSVYRFKDKYIQLEEIQYDDKVFGVAIDVTAEITERIKIEKERDTDALTGLYNRRGLNNQLDEIFNGTDNIGLGAMIMIDADGLKQINDNYGHDKGDVYLKEIGKLVLNAGTQQSIASRQGGDEFVLFMYGYDSEKTLIDDIKNLQSQQSNNIVDLGDDISVQLKFSLGYSLIGSKNNYDELIKDADEKMYKNKQERKENR